MEVIKTLNAARLFNTVPLFFSTHHCTCPILARLLSQQKSSLAFTTIHASPFTVPQHCAIATS